MTYINEREMKFEKFFAKLVKSVDYLDRFDCRINTADIVDLIWKNMTNPDLSQYVTDLKVQFQREPRD